MSSLAPLSRALLAAGFLFATGVHAAPQFVNGLTIPANTIDATGVPGANAGRVGFFSDIYYDPNRNDLFTASRGAGAFLNDRRIRVGKRTQLSDCLVATGHPHVNTNQLDLDMAQLKAMIQRTVGVRREGSAALDLAYVACGRTDGYWEMNLKPWDIAAGSLLVQEAGGIITDLTGNEGWLESGDILAANPKIMHQMLQVLNQVEL